MADIYAKGIAALDVLLTDKTSDDAKRRVAKAVIDATFPALENIADAPPPPVADDEYQAQQLADGHIDFLEEKADFWMEQIGVRRMLHAIGSAFAAAAPPEHCERFNASMASIARQCFVEGALRSWEDIAAQGGLIRIVKSENDDTLPAHKGK